MSAVSGTGLFVFAVFFHHCVLIFTFSIVVIVVVITVTSLSGTGQQEPTASASAWTAARALPASPRRMLCTSSSSSDASKPPQRFVTVLPFQLHR
jgi:hypothetical protein